ncbi:16S rRNA (guanine(966)-N(2))-methyltransferase RsmD [Simiduia aestuariiviva]|uniref:Ribosomal RNA small subunit methyltransferase D n=1 Tax=Simiduia aestuariiviva TaxID=1510459 RepID=A0A839UWR3_9GAMM|nr:16S rRNA (guanine(966)-N(2))-methyltransferase RsmD [Simiduia aestuariiviva]MBB3169898.1 16S rRNA (guanine966-N2)-methyltransferase [Simiduia aestuariiviva]
MKKRPLRQPESHGQLRIIGGQWRGRKLRFPVVAGLRPTGDRVRETLFNWLQMSIAEARCLDVFAGAGGLGLEALSRGCTHCTMIEKDTQACRQLDANLQLLQAQGAEVVQADALAWLAGYTGPGFDVVFLDPPFAADLWQASLDQIGTHLNPNAQIYVEAPVGKALITPNNWQLHREKCAGEVCYRLYHCL